MAMKRNLLRHGTLSATAMTALVLLAVSALVFSLPPPRARSV